MMKTKDLQSQLKANFGHAALMLFRSPDWQMAVAYSNAETSKQLIEQLVHRMMDACANNTTQAFSDLVLATCDHCQQPLGETAHDHGSETICYDCDKKIEDERDRKWERENEGRMYSTREDK